MFGGMAFDPFAAPFSTPMYAAPQVRRPVRQPPREQYVVVEDEYGRPVRVPLSALRAAQARQAAPRSAYYDHYDPRYEPVRRPVERFVHDDDEDEDADVDPRYARAAEMKRRALEAQRLRELEQQRLVELEEERRRREIEEQRRRVEEQRRQQELRAQEQLRRQLEHQWHVPHGHGHAHGHSQAHAQAAPNVVPVAVRHGGPVSIPIVSKNAEHAAEAERKKAEAERRAFEKKVSGLRNLVAARKIQRWFRKLRARRAAETIVRAIRRHTAVTAARRALNSLRKLRDIEERARSITSEYVESIPAARNAVAAAERAGDAATVEEARKARDRLVRAHNERLLQLLLKIDELSTAGSDYVRERRKAAVNAIEASIRDAEKAPQLQVQPAAEEAPVTADDADAAAPVAMECEQEAPQVVDEHAGGDVEMAEVGTNVEEETSASDEQALVGEEGAHGDDAGDASPTAMVVDETPAVPSQVGAPFEDASSDSPTPGSCGQHATLERAEAPLCYDADGSRSAAQAPKDEAPADVGIVADVDAHGDDGVDRAADSQDSCGHAVTAPDVVMTEEAQTPSESVDRVGDVKEQLSEAMDGVANVQEPGEVDFGAAAAESVVDGHSEDSWEQVSNTSSDGRGECACAVARAEFSERGVEAEPREPPPDETTALLARDVPNETTPLFSDVHNETTPSIADDGSGAGCAEGEAKTCVDGDGVAATDGLFAAEQ
eukprot:Opistho-1_new@82309